MTRLVAPLMRRLRTHVASQCAVAAIAAVSVVAPVLQGQARSPVIQDRVRLDPSEPVGFRVLLTPDTVYVGQQATYEIGVFITESAQQRMRRNPEVVPAELRGVLAYDLGGPQSLPAITQNGTRSFPHVLQRALFPLAPGRLEIPASQLTYTLPRSASFFSREESAVMRADDVALYVRPLPRTGQPDDFSGAVGVLSVRASVDTAGARVGEPVLLTVRVMGRGNVKLWPRPEVATPGAALVAAGERVTVDTSGQYVRGTKEFDWLVTPQRVGPLAVPVIEYAYFDPYEASYRVASSEPIGITIADGEFVSAPMTVVERDGLALRRVDRGERGRPLSRHPLLWALVALAPLPALRRRRATRTREASGRVAHAVAEERAEPRMRALSSNERARRSAAEARKQLLDALAAQLATTATALVAHSALERRLRRRGVTRGTTQLVLALVADLDTAAWARDADSAWRHEADVRARIDALLAQVTLEAVPVATPDGAPTRSGRASATLLLLLLLASGSGAATLHARSEQPSSFVAGVESFERQRYGESAAHFLALATAAPQHADAWANAGTAAWAANDTVAAVRGWQRALRLEPDAADVRRHLALLPSGSWDGVARVPNVPRDVGTLVAALCWCLGWAGVLWVRRDRERAQRTDAARVGRAVPGALLLVALLLGGWQWRLEAQLAHAALSVVSRAEPMHVAPGRDANVFGGTARGDLVRLEESRREGASGEAWGRVTHADGRAGWLPVKALVSLE